MPVDRLSSLLTELQITAVMRPPVAAGDLFIYAPQGPKSDYVLHNSLAPSEGETSALLVAISLRWGGRSDPMSPVNGAFGLTIQSDTPLGALVSLLVEEVAEPRCGAPSLLARYAEALVVHFLRAMIESGQTSTGLIGGLSDPRISRALVRMHEAPQTQWRVQDLADIAGMSRSGFMARFGDILGEGPMSYLRRWRLMQARSALAAGGRVAEVARRFGYGSADAFSRAFLRFEGELPSAYRARLLLGGEHAGAAQTLARARLRGSSDSISP